MLPSTDFDDGSQIFKKMEIGSMGVTNVTISISDVIGTDKTEPLYLSDYSGLDEPDLNGRYAGNYEIDSNQMVYSKFDKVCSLYK